MSIYKKLLEIQKQVKGLGKDKKSFNFDYVTGNKLLDHIKPIMNEVGVLLKQEVTNVETEHITYTTGKGNNVKEKTEMLYKVWQKFTWIDAETGDKDESMFFASGQNDWEKGLGSALTYAERYFILKFFHIATDEDDIDNPDRKSEEPIKPKADLATESQLKMLRDLLKRHNISEEKVCKDKKINKLEEMKREIASKAIKYFSELKGDK